MNIGLIAHDSKKKLMQNFCIAYRGILCKHALYATGTTGSLIEEAANLNVYKYLAGHLGGEQQMCSQIEQNDLDLLIFIRDPENPKSHFAVPGIYFYDNEVIKIAQEIKPSARGELEITDVNKMYMERGNLKVIPLGRGYAWFDTGTPERLNEAGDFVKAIESRQGVQIACLEEIAYTNGWINKEQALKLAEKYKKTDYGKYIMKVIGE